MVAPSVRQINMAAPSAVNVDVTLTDEQTSLAFQTLASPNRLLDITNETDPAANSNYVLKLLRSGREVRRWNARGLLTTIDRHVGFPLDMAPGQIQWEGYQTGSAGAAAHNYLCTYVHDL